jgi:D-alanyl-D-alanine carboxypeptidase
MKNPLFSQIVSTKTVQIGKRYFRNHNKLLWQLKGADGVKTGYTRAAGRILVSSAERNGRRLIAVTIADPNDWNDHVELMESGFSEFHECVVVTENALLGETEIAGGECERVALLAKESFVYPLSASETVEIRLPDPGFVYAPIAEGQNAGFAQLYLSNQYIGRVQLVYGQTIEQEIYQKDNLWKRVFGGRSA